VLSTSDFKNGLKIEIDGEPYVIIEFLHVKPGKGGAFVRTKLKNMKDDSVIDRTFRAGEKVAEAKIEEKEMQYLYSQDENYYFLDLETYEQISLRGDQLEGVSQYLADNTNLVVLYFKKEPITVNLPTFVKLKVVKTEPAHKGNTASGGSKPAELETSVIIQVPFFISEGDIVKVDTRTGEYIERVSK
jgi:elongation factor P